MKPSYIRLIISSLLVLIVGVILGRISSPKQETASTATETTTKTQRTQGSASQNSGVSLLLSTYTLDEISDRVKSDYAKPEKDQNYAQLSILFNEWVLNAPFEALNFALESGRDDWVLQGLRIAGQQDPDTAFSWIDKSSKDLFRRLTLKEEVFSGIAQVNPEGAIARIEQMKPGQSQDRLALPVLAEWAAQDVDKVFEWIDSQESGPLKEKAYESVWFQFINSNPQEAMATISTMEENVDKINFANRATFKNAEEDLEGTKQWVESQEGETKRFALMGLMEYWAQSENSAEALTYASELPENPNNSEVFSMVSFQMSQDKPDQLAQELSSFNEKQQLVVAQHLAQTYSNHNSEKAYNWLESLPQGAVRDTAISTSLNSLNYSDVAQAFALTESITDTSLRQKELSKSLEVWVSTDPEAAYNALDNTAILTLEEKESIKSQLIDKQIPTPDFVLPATQ